MRKIKFIPDNYYHIYNRGVDKRKVFIDKSDYYRFVHYLYEFNNKEPVINLTKKNMYQGSASVYNKRKLLVDIICFCLMPTHYHLILRQKEDNGINGIVKFMHKLGTGYTMYFNKKNERTGVLFNSRFKAILIEKDEYLVHLSRYIHLNPLKHENNAPQQKEKNVKEIEKKLEGYKWSSYLDYIGKNNFPSIVSKNFILDYFKTEREYKEFVVEYASESNNYTTEAEPR